MSLVSGGSGSAIPWGDAIKLAPMEELRTSYFARMIVKDRPKVLGQIAMAFGNHDVSLSAMEMRVLDPVAVTGEIVFLTHPCQEGNFRRALQEIDREEIIERVANWIRVES